MDVFSPDQRTRPMLDVVSWRRQVPMFRMHAFWLYHVGLHGAPVDVFSADRRHQAIDDHNRQFKTGLHSQEQLVALFRAGRGNPANSPSTTSHCLFSDGSQAYRVDGRQIPAGAPLPPFMLGIDLSDRGKAEDVRQLLAVSHRLGYKPVQPYPVGGERHHVVLEESPVARLEGWNIISANRS